jgi:hypothetical protein
MTKPAIATPEIAIMKILNMNPPKAPDNAGALAPLAIPVEAAIIEKIMSTTHIMETIGKTILIRLA